MSSPCVLCDRTFDSDEALQQHKRDSRAHAFDRTTCDRHSATTRLCSNTYETSPFMPRLLTVRPAIDPSAARRHSNSTYETHPYMLHPSTVRRATDPEHHLRDLPVYAPSFDCESWNRSFGGEEALEQHLRDSRVHQQAPETPLDIFFCSFQTFEYDPSLPPATSYAYLRERDGWRRGDAASDNAWNRYQDSLESELRMWYGTENDLTAWHALCRSIGVEPLPQTCKQCEEAVQRTHVNIVDLIEWGRRRGNTEERV